MEGESKLVVLGITLLVVGVLGFLFSSFSVFFGILASGVFLAVCGLTIGFEEPLAKKPPSVIEAPLAGESTQGMVESAGALRLIKSFCPRCGGGVDAESLYCPTCGEEIRGRSG